MHQLGLNPQRAAGFNTTFESEEDWANTSFGSDGQVLGGLLGSRTNKELAARYDLLLREQAIGLAGA
jgi:hypothetical protein